MGGAVGVLCVFGALTNLAMVVASEVECRKEEELARVRWMTLASRLASQNLWMSACVEQGVSARCAW